MLEKEFKKQENQKKKEAEEEKFQKLALSEEKFKEWKKNKIIQRSSTEKLRIQTQSVQENMNKNKQLAAKEKYHEWLRSSLQSLKKLKSLEKKEKLKQEQEKQKKEAEKKIKSEKSNLVYQQWLENKKLIKKKKPRMQKKKIKQKKIIMLAYSPNRKKSVSSSFEENFENFSKNVKSCTSSEEERMENPIFLPDELKKLNFKKSEDCQVFEELSSIHKSHKAHSIFQYEEDVESFISELEHHDIN